MQILLVGKSQHLMRECSTREMAISQSFDKIVQLFSDEKLEGIALEDAFSKVKDSIELIEKLVNRSLLKLFLDKYNLLGHCVAIQRYLLLGQGDFIRILMDMLK